MAQRVNIVLVDDLDGSEATETISFGLDGDTYEIDLSTENAKTMREALIGYAKVARVVQRRRGRKPAALVEAQKQVAAKPTTGSKPRGGRKRTATVDADGKVTQDA